MNYNLKKNLNSVNIYFLFLISILAIINFFLEIPSEYKYFFCFLLIATIGVSHGAYDGKKGEKLFYNKFKNWRFIFYFTYFTLAIFVLIIWSISPLVALITFLIVSSLHFGKEDLEIYLNKKYKYHLLIYFLKGSLIILLPLFFSFEKTNLIFNTILFSKNYVLLSNNNVKFILIINLSIQILFYLFIFLKKKLKRNDLIAIIFEIYLIIITFYLFNPVIAFTLYFCFMHSLKNILHISNELDPKLLKGLKIFLKQSLFLTLLTFFILFFCFIFLINFNLFENSAEKIIFIGLASLTLPHIILHYFSENY